MDSPDLSSLDGLTRIGFGGGVDMRPTLIRVLTDLYVQKLQHTTEEERHYTELALRLLEGVDAATRASVSKRLARHLAPPLRVLQYLVNDLPEIAAPLRGHPLLQPRQPAPAADASHLVSRLAPDILAVAATPAGPEPRPQAATQEIVRAVDLTVIDLTIADDLNEQFFAASETERRLILLNLHVAAPLPAGHVAVSRDAAVIARLEQTALGRNRDGFTHTLAEALRIPQPQAHRIARDSLGEPLAVAAKALAIPRDVVYRILMFVNPAVGHSVARVHALATLYDEMTMPAAEGMVAIWQALKPGERAAAKHQPLSWNDDTYQRARSDVTVRRAPAASRPNERRDVS
jgi:hypothetical protein